MSAADANYSWPPSDRTIALSVDQLVDQAGFHWFNGYDSTTSPARALTLYRNEVALLNQYNAMQTTLVDTLASVAVTVDIHVGALGFAAVVPPNPDGSAYFAEANESWQASMAVRSLAVLYCLSEGKGSASWFTFLLQLSDVSAMIGWNQYFGMSLHNDDKVAGGAPSATTTRGQVAYRRPVWYAIRRLIWLVSRSNAVEVLYAERGAVVLQFTARAGFGPAMSWRYLTIAWVDQYAADRDAVGMGNERTGGISLTFPSPDYEEASLVPEVTPATTVDPLGYEDSSPTWGSVPGPVSVVKRSGTSIKLLVSPADPSAAPAPVAVYTNRQCSRVQSEDGR